MPVLGLTGGIATGKSSFVRALQAHLAARVFDADEAAHELLAHDPGVHQAVEEAFGPDVFGADARPDRARLRALVFADPDARRRLEETLHPLIRTRWIAESARYETASDWLLVDIPLLYETGAQSSFARIAVVACSLATQRARLRQHRGLDDTLIENIIGAQLDLGLKVSQAQHVVWNDSSLSALDRQARLLAGLLCHVYV